jgi:CheY-like chemotaxis protein
LILVVDDESLNVIGIKIILQCIVASMPGFNFEERVVSASNGLQAVELVKKLSDEGKHFDLIFMDCNMPRMNGCEASLQIRQYLQDHGKMIPLICALTGQG